MEEDPHAPVHNVVTFHVLQLSKTKRANQFFVSDSFQGNCMQSRWKEIQTSIQFVYEQCFRKEGGDIYFFFYELFQLFNSKSELSTEMRLVQPVLYSLNGRRKKVVLLHKWGKNWPVCFFFFSQGVDFFLI